MQVVLNNVVKATNVNFKNISFPIFFLKVHKVFIKKDINTLSKRAIKLEITRLKSVKLTIINIKNLDNSTFLKNSNFEKNLKLFDDRYKNLNLKIEIV